MNKRRREDEFYRAIVLLRDCGGMSFYMIAMLLRADEKHKRNMEYFYEQSKEKYLCLKIQNQNKGNG